MKKVITATAAAMFLAGTAGAAMAGGGLNDRMSSRKEVDQIKQERMQSTEQRIAALEKHLKSMQKDKM